MNAENDHQRYVAFFDALGFKEAVVENLDEAWGALEDLRVSMEETLNLFVKLPGDTIIIPNKERAAATNFSDSVIIFTKGGEVEDLHSIFLTSTSFFAKALYRCVPLRGAISYGKFYFNPEKNLFCGIPLIRAYELAEMTQWSGIVVDQCVADRYWKEPLLSADKAAVVKWDISVKEDAAKKAQSLWALDWPLICRENFAQDTPISAELYSKAFDSLFGCSYEDWPQDVQAKYDNTVIFINRVLRSR